jgi:uncharacterized protein (TIGR03437 family)
VRIAPSGGAPGGPVSVPIELVSQGDENSAGFSVNFDPAILSSPQAALGRDAAGAQFDTNSGQASQGRFGLTISLPTNQRFTAGTRQIAVLTFNIAASVSVPSTMVNFGDQPVTREISDANANPLPANYTAGAVTITSGYEADVAPRPNGNNNGQVTITDAVQVGRFVAGLETPDAGSEFQRADCAPRDTLGDGRLSIIDWAQANRYAAGLDQVAPAGGPTAPAASGLLATQASNTRPAAPSGHTKRVVRIAAAPQWVNGERVVTIDLDAVGGEYALGFSLLFNPSEWRFVSAAIGRDAQEAALHLNESDAARGRVGLALSLPAGRSFNPGERQLAVLRFAPRSADQEIPFLFGFSDTPVAREVADTEARSLAARFEVKADALTLANVSAASFADGPVAREQIVTAFGANLAAGVERATTLPLPTELIGARALITDSQGTKRAAPLFFVSRSQANYQIPPDVALGPATVEIASGDGAVSIGLIEITETASSLFTANGDGQGVAAAVALRVRAGGSMQYEPVSRFDAERNRFVASPIAAGAEGELVYLILYGTGVRGRSSLSKVAAQIGHVRAQVLYAGAQGEMAGVDQINLLIPRSLAGAGEVDLALNVDGAPANVVKVHIR